MSAPDPVTLEVVRNALYAVAEEMSVIVMRSARSPLLKEAGDLSSALTAGVAIAGPAMIEDESSTIIVYPGQRAAADRLGNLLIEAAA